MYSKRMLVSIVAGCSCVLLAVVLAGSVILGKRESNLHSTVKQAAPVSAEGSKSRPNTTEKGVPVPISGVADANSGVKVEWEGRTVTAVGSDGKVKWSVDVIARCGVPFVGSPVIRNVQVQGDRVIVVFGKHSEASINLESGEVHYLGAD